MATPQPQPEILTDAEILSALAAPRCLVDAGRKSPGSPFCQTCFLALPLYLRNWVTQRPDASSYPDTFRSALAHLRAISTRRVRHLVNGARWRHHSHAELARAGYTLCESPYARCAAPGCAQPLVWYWTPRGHKLAINEGDCQPHFNTCAAPDYFRERRKLQTSAGRKSKSSSTKANHA